jgi:hypothetical protein
VRACAARSAADPKGAAMTEEKAKRPYRKRVVIRPKSHIWRTNLAVPDELSAKIEREAALDFRTYKLEIVALVAEAIEARELKRQTSCESHEEGSKDVAT